jgi:hypothetical protein
LPQEGRPTQNPGVASFPQTNTTGFNDFSYLVNNWWPKNEKIKRSESKQAENSNLNLDVIYKCHITNSKQSGTIGY